MAASLETLQAAPISPKDNTTSISRIDVKSYVVFKSLQKCLQLLAAFVLLSSLRHYFDSTSPFLEAPLKPSLRVQPLPFSRRLQEVSRPTNAITQFDIVVPIFERDPNVRQFAARLKPSLQEYAQLTAQNATKITTFRLLITRYGKTEQANANALQQELATLAGLPLDQIVMVLAPSIDVKFTRAHAVNLLMTAACHDPHCLVARIDVDMELKAGFYIHAERDAVAGQSAYFPIVWSAFFPTTPTLVQFALDIQNYKQKQPRQMLPQDSPHRGHWRDYGTGMWAIAGPDCALVKFNEEFKGWGGEDGDFYNRIKEQRTIIRRREPGLVHLWHPKDCTPGVTVFTETQISECNGSRIGEEGDEYGRRLLRKWKTQHETRPSAGQKPIWQA